VSFWLARQSSHPLLAPFALDIVAAPASQAYVERVFSVCGDLCARKRNRENRNLERRIFQRMNKSYTMAV
jgi:hAT family C-terminal dimerisation region